MPSAMDGRGLSAMLEKLEAAARSDASSEAVLGTAGELLSEAWGRGWMVIFDWPSWREEARRLVEEPGALGCADLDAARKLLTTYIRQDRFIEGSLEAEISAGALVPVFRRLVACWQALNPVGAWLETNNCYVPIHVGWDELEGEVRLSSARWQRLKDRGFVGDQDCKWAIARVFRVYAMWRISDPGAPALVVSREGTSRVRAWARPGFELDGPALLEAFASAATYREHG